MERGSVFDVAYKNVRHLFLFSSVLRLDLENNMHIFVSRVMVYLIVMKLGKQFYICMFAHSTGF